MEFVVRTWELLVLFHIWLGLFYGHIPDVRMGSHQDSSSRLKVWPRFHSLEEVNWWQGLVWSSPVWFTALQFRRPKTGFRQSWDFDYVLILTLIFHPEVQGTSLSFNKTFYETEPRIILMDTTLRDGEQTQGISFAAWKRPMWLRLF